MSLHVRRTSLLFEKTEPRTHRERPQDGILGEVEFDEAPQVAKLGGDRARQGKVAAQVEDLQGLERPQLKRQLA
jgi:hypothetical protein